MLVRFWGTRGSLPVALNATSVQDKLRAALREAIASGVKGDDKSIDAFLNSKLSFGSRGTYGGNSSCVAIQTSDSPEFVVCDAGSGLREFGTRVVDENGPSGSTINLFMSHPHWDHIMGFPFFTPGYIPENHVRIFGCHDSIEAVLRTQNSAPYFPAPFSALGADIEFHTLVPGETVEVAGLKVTPAKQRHGGHSYGYRFEHGDGTVVYSTDGEHKLEAPAELEAVVEFFRGADLVIFDAMYSLADAISVREDWGHSSNLVGVDLCLRAGVSEYCMFHHEPMNDDHTLDQILAETRHYEELSRDGYSLKVTSAYDGLEIQI
jgi:phosphoribosyl 1,2-cyclic phosphodiesterase